MAPSTPTLFHRSDHLVACGGVEAVRRTGPRPAGMISIEGMNLNVDDWHGRPPLVRPIVRHRDRFAQSDERGDGWSVAGEHLGRVDGFAERDLWNSRRRDAPCGRPHALYSNPFAFRTVWAAGEERNVTSALAASI